MRDEDAYLLRRYLEEGSEPAFTEVVRRHVGLVYGVALRRLDGEAQLAEDVTQRVFTDLARKAAALAGHPSLGAWLFRSARYAAAQVGRAERRRKAREQKAHEMNELTNRAGADPNWSELRSVLDEVMEELSERERVALWLRFYEGKGFAEIGGRLRASDDAVRMRVERGLEKMRVSLARRGITSTTTALSSALAQGGGAAAPAGLTASVARAALAGAAAGGGVGVGGGLAAFGLMTTAKIGGGLLAVSLALSLSVAGNIFLLTHRAPHAASTPAPTAALPEATPVDLSLALLAKGDAAALRDRLRAAGASETTVRGIVEGVLRRRYRETLSARRAETMQHAWWNDAPWFFFSDLPGRFADDPPLLRELVLDPLERLFGPDPVDLAEKEARFEFLPPARRPDFIALERDFEAALSRIPGADKNPSLGANARREHDEKERQLVATLSPAERAEYELRFSATARGLRERMSQIDASEQEYRAIMALVAAPGSPADQNAPIQKVLGTDDSSTRLARQLVAALGHDRALDYIWAGAWEYPNYARVARDAGLPASTPARVLELAAETTAQAETIHGDAMLTPVQKRAAVVALQQEVRPRLDALLPPEQQQRLPARVLGWFTALGDGRYSIIPTTAAGSTGGVMSGGPGIPVDSALPANRTPRQFMLPRPKG
jgi:RNA polymerase sigma factor (sigma-70 family)